MTLRKYDWKGKQIKVLYYKTKSTNLVERRLTVICGPQFLLCIIVLLMALTIGNV